MAFISELTKMGHTDAVQKQKKVNQRFADYLITRLNTLLLVICLGSGLSVYLFTVIRAWEKEQQLSEFEKKAEKNISSFKESIKKSFFDIDALASFYDGSYDVERLEFKKFVKHLLFNNPAIQALEWIPRVPDSYRTTYEENPRMEGFSNFKITERNARGAIVKASRRDEYYPVYFVEPYEGNEAAHGFDLASNPITFEALKRARDTGKSTATARIDLMQKKGKQFGFMIFHPIYLQDMPIDSLEARRKAVKSFVVGVFSIDDLLKNSLKNFYPHDIDIHLYDNSAPITKRFLYSYTPNSRTASYEEAVITDNIRYSAILDVADRKWQYVYTPSKNFLSQTSWEPWVVLSVGLIFTGLFSGYILLIFSRIDKARRYAKEILSSKEKLEYEITERKQAERALYREAKINKAIADLSTAIISEASIDDISLIVDEHAKRITRSKVSFVGYIDPITAYLVCSTMKKDIWDKCQVHEKEFVFKKFSGLWGRVLKNKKSILTNAPDDDPRSSGTPLGHISIHRFLSAPALMGKKILGQIAVANSDRDYTEKDLELIEHIAGLYAIAIQRKQSEDKSRQSAKVFDNTNEGVMITDVNAFIIAVNRAFTQITGYHADEVLGRNPNVLKSGRHNREFYQNMWASIQKKGQWQGEIWNRRKNGEVYPQWINISVVKDNSGAIGNYVAIFSDISTLKESEKQLERLAHHDPLTELPNRLLFNDRLKHAVEHAKRRGLKVSLLYIDLDNFKDINDIFGHPFGDRLLQSVADRLRACARSEDTVARLGGDEFSIIVEDTSGYSGASIIAQRILNDLSQPISIEGNEVFTAASIGISIYPDHGKDVHVLMKNADTAMYQAKKMGRNNYQFYASEMTALAQERIMLETALRYALQREEFLLYYQPQVNIKRMQIVGAEALIRWEHPKKGLVVPEQFIPLAEEMGLISSIGEWVLYAACKQGRRWQLASYPSLRISVNISSHQFRRQNLIMKINHILKDTGLESRFLELEITESTLLENMEENVNILKELTAMGIHFAIDDFGTGYSSLNYLKRFPIDRLKIDKSFIKNIPHNADDIAITNTIIAMAHSLDVQVIAEGVETKQQLKFLRSRNCDEVQGYLFSPPVTAKEFTECVAII